MTPSTEITLVHGGSYQVEGDVRAVEGAILDAARGSLMEFAWFTDAESREELAVNPECVAMLRAISS